MIYEPTILFNPKDRAVEFMYDRRIYVFEPGEKKLVDGIVADHAIRFVNTGLKVYEPESDDKKVESSNVAYNKMAWGPLKKLASDRGVFEFGMKKAQIVKALIEADESKGI